MLDPFDYAWLVCDLPFCMNQAFMAMDGFIFLDGFVFSNFDHALSYENDKLHVDTGEKKSIYQLISLLQKC